MTAGFSNRTRAKNCGRKDETSKMLLFPSSRGGVAATIKKNDPVPKQEQTGWSESFPTTPAAPF
jgi:hypothetical protein